MTEHEVPGETLPAGIALALALAGFIAAQVAAHMLVRSAESARQRETEPRPSARPPEHRSGREELVRERGSAGVTQRSGRAAAVNSAPRDEQAVGHADRAETTVAAGRDDGDSDCPPLFTVGFAPGRVTPRAPQLEERTSALSRWLLEHADAQLIVAGHADAAGAERNNLALSYRRAQAVASLFVRTGLPPHRVTARAFGEYQPVAGAAQASERNRRVELEVPGFCVGRQAKGNLE